MNVVLRITATCNILSALAACGGGSSSGAVAPLSAPPPPAITGRFNVPSTGVSNYTGFMNLNLPVGQNREVATGRLELAINFGAGTEQITGTATDFSLPSGGALTGQLFIDESALQPEQGSEPPGFEAEISGALRGGSLINTLITGDLEADFDTTDVSTASGQVFGDVTTSQGVDVFDGSFSIAVQ